MSNAMLPVLLSGGVELDKATRRQVDAIIRRNITIKAEMSAQADRTGHAMTQAARLGALNEVLTGAVPSFAPQIQHIANIGVGLIGWTLASS